MLPGGKIEKIFADAVFLAMCQLLRVICMKLGRSIASRPENTKSARFKVRSLVEQTFVCEESTLHHLPRTNKPGLRVNILGSGWGLQMCSATHNRSSGSGMSGPSRRRGEIKSRTG